MEHKNSSAQQPDLDWSQVRETVKLLSVSSAQVQSSMREGDDSVNTLTNSFAEIVGHLEDVSKELNALEDGATKESIKQHCLLAHNKVHESIMAFQFYDRMQQCLEHVTSNLNGLSEIVESPNLLYNPMEWKKLQNMIREKYTMESEKAMFDAILEGKTVEEAIQIATEYDDSAEEGDEIELF
ncbi:MAG: hypothetical protein PSN04_00715 [Methyloprofundus sp.]|nr:hypothetical protein [Methyloprofundus sp.]